MMYMYYLILAAHICLFTDISRLQKQPTCKLNFIVACFMSSVAPLLLFEFVTFNSPLAQHLMGVSITTVLCVLVTLNIQKVIRINIDF